MTPPRASPRRSGPARAFPGLRVIPGIELSTDVPGSEIHVLGYHVDLADAGLVSRPWKTSGAAGRSVAC